MTTEATPRPFDAAILPHMQRFDEQMTEDGLSVTEWRGRYRALLAEQPRPGEPVATRDFTIPTRHDELAVRLYSPPNPRALLLYMHGGGFVVGDLDSVDPVLHNVSRGAEVAILSLDYLLAPEHMYPVAFEQSIDALQWAASNRDLLGVTGPLGVAGDSAGGNLTALVTQWSLSHQGPFVAWQGLVNPVLDFLALNNPPAGSHKVYGESPMLNVEAMKGFMSAYFEDEQAKFDASPLRTIEDYSAFPAAFVAVGQCDALRDEGVEYARRLAIAGVPTTLTMYEGMPHNFITLTSQSRAAARFVQDFIRSVRDWADGG